MGSKNRNIISYAYTAEIDHIDKENNKYEHFVGIFSKYVPPLSTVNGDASLTVSHAEELFDAVSESYSKGLKCRLLQVKGTKYGTIKGGIRAAVDGDYWMVKQFSGTVEQGFRFVLERVE